MTAKNKIIMPMIILINDTVIINFPTLVYFIYLHLHKFSAN